MISPAFSCRHSGIAWPAGWQVMAHYIGVVASLAIRWSPVSNKPANLLLIPARTPRMGARGRVRSQGHFTRERLERIIVFRDDTCLLGGPLSASTIRTIPSTWRLIAAAIFSLAAGNARA